MSLPALEGIPDGGLELAVFHNESQFRNSDIVGAEIQARCAVIAKYRHVIDRVNPRLIKGFPYSQVLQELRAAGTNGVNPAVPAVISGEGGRRTRFHQCYFQAAVFEGKRQACSHQSSANNNDIEFHKGIIQTVLSDGGEVAMPEPRKFYSWRTL